MLWNKINFKTSHAFIANFWIFLINGSCCSYHGQFYVIIVWRPWPWPIYIYIYIVSKQSISQLQNFLKNLSSPYPTEQRVPTGQCPAHLDKVWYAQTVNDGPRQCVARRVQGYLNPWTVVSLTIFISLSPRTKSNRWLLGRVRLHPRVLLLSGNPLPHLLHAFVALQAFKVKFSFFYPISQST
jgi:hypothetical protein